jgi:hypothetical protein
MAYFNLCENVLGNNFKRVSLFLIVFSFCVQGFSVNTKKKKDPTFAIGIGMVVGAAGLAAACAFHSPSSLSSQKNNLSAISRALASQQAASSGARSGASEQASLGDSQDNLSCLKDDDWNLRAFRVTALRYQLHNASLVCRDLNPRWVSLYQKHLPVWKNNVDQIETYFGSSQRGSRADTYSTELANELSLRAAKRVRSGGDESYCSEMRALYLKVERAPSSMELVKFAVSEPQPILSPCHLRGSR